MGGTVKCSSAVLSTHFRDPNGSISEYGEGGDPEKSLQGNGSL